jgi:signal recognition particle GTPase
VPPAPAPVPFVASPLPTAPTPVRSSRRRGGIAPVAERMLRAALAARDPHGDRRGPELGAPAGSPWTEGRGPADATPAQHTHPEEVLEQRRAAELGRVLVDRGFSTARASELVAAAIARRGPFTGGDELGELVRAVIADALPEPHMLPVDGGAFAIVGAGGSGKTHCVSALAAAHARAGVAPVSVARLGFAGHEGELVELLHGEDVHVIPGMRTRPMARAVNSARDHGLVLIDTAAAGPGDASALDVLVEALRPFQLDGVYLAVPATLSARAAARLAEGFSGLALLGLIATHVDEADQLGTIAELAMTTGIPIGYLHGGTNLQTAITAASPDQLAAQLVR